MNFKYKISYLSIMPKYHIANRFCTVLTMQRFLIAYECSTILLSNGPHVVAAK